MVDGLVLTALDCAWGHWERAAKGPHRPFSDPEYLKAVAGLPWRWDDWIPAGLFGRGLDAAWWGRLVDAMDDLGRFGLSDTAIVRRDLMDGEESMLAIRDDWEWADFEACELSNPHMPDPYECVVNDLRLLAEDMDKEPRRMGGLVRYDTAYALAGFKYLTFKEDDDE